MDMIKSVFPQAAQAHDVKSLLIAIIIYVVINFVGGFVLGLLGKLPFIGFVFGVIGWAISIYCAVGVIVALLVFLKVLK